MTSFLPTSRSTRAAFLVVAIAAFVVGVAVGRLAAYYQTAGAAFGGGAVVLVLLAIGLCVFALVALVAARLVGASTLAARRVVVLAVVSATGGATLGAVTAAATGGTYTEPVVLEAPGSITFELTDAEPAFDPGPASTTCISGPDSQTVALVEISELGTLGGGALSATVLLDIGEERRHDVSLQVDGISLADRSQPIWAGPAEVVDLGADRASGSLRFTNLPIEDLRGVPPPEPPWDSPLSGAITWTCEPWS